MPLPPALLARLQQRGIVTSKEEAPNTSEHLEEVIAEDYDSEKDEDSDSSGSEGEQPAQYESLDEDDVVAGCPNKYNIYHSCTTFCRERWANGKEAPSSEMERKYQWLIKRYPLPEGWQDVWEPGVGTYYFWNTENDEVSWLPPLHPDAKVSAAAAKLRKLMKEQEANQDSSDAEGESEDESSSDSSDSSEILSTVPLKEAPQPQRKKFKPDRPFDVRRDRPRRNDIDPMDPASYSESCPRGNWGAGLGHADD
ncbi:Polyglutamine-binding protein 1 [Halotydeus destructor]|nr:Polyglutamine-binding protein 1 [Halotydeus destructor]